MNVYDQAHMLVRAIKECEEYKQYQAAKEKAFENEYVSKMISDIQEKQIPLQAAQMMGQEIDPEAMKEVQALYAAVMTDPLAAQYMQCEVRFSLMMNDVYKILAETLGLPTPPEKQ
ncbi:MAG: YlbF family regulator [Clostridia bacterium]|nr:YlbF family regulator [Clostridia bacterium]